MPYFRFSEPWPIPSLGSGVLSIVMVRVLIHGQDGYAALPSFVDSRAISQEEYLLMCYLWVRGWGMERLMRSLPWFRGIEMVNNRTHTKEQCQKAIQAGQIIQAG